MPKAIGRQMNLSGVASPETEIMRRVYGAETDKGKTSYLNRDAASRVRP